MKQFFSKKPIHFIMTLMIALVFHYSCKKGDPAPETVEVPEAYIQQYQASGFNHLARIDTYTESGRFTNPGYFIYPLDLKLVQDKLMFAWNIEEYTLSVPQGHITTNYGTISSGKFSKSMFAPCGDPSVSSSFKRSIRYRIDDQGNLFTSYRWHDNSSASLAWQHSFCLSSGLVSGGDYVDYPLVMDENNGLVTAMGGWYYNGLAYPGMKHFRFTGSGWQGEPLNGLQPEIQGFDYHVTPTGNEFLAYTNRSGGELDGNMNLMGFDGVSWYNLGQIQVQGIRKVAGVNIQTYYEPFNITILRNGETPYILMFRDNNTLALFRFNGTSLELINNAVKYPSDLSNTAHFCVYQNRLVTLGISNSTGLLDNKQAVYQLNGDNFEIVKTLPVSGATITGVWSDNAHLWVSVERFTAENGFFHSPLDILELK